MPPTIEGASAADQAEVTNAIRRMLDHVTTQITNAALQSCLLARARGGDKIIVGGERCFKHLWGYTRRTAIGPFTLGRSKDIHVCLNNVHRSRVDLATVLMHEWAHTCGWEEGGGMGVPENGADFRFP